MAVARWWTGVDKRMDDGRRLTVRGNLDRASSLTHWPDRSARHNRIRELQVVVKREKKLSQKVSLVPLASNATSSTMAVSVARLARRSCCQYNGYPGEISN